MDSSLQALLELLRVSPMGEDRFQGPSEDLGWGTVFGGQVLAQALFAAGQTLPSERLVHSLHAYFLRPGRVDTPIDLEVDRIRDGRSFATRRVVARQGHKAIFNLSASFHHPEDGFDHQHHQMPKVASPDSLESEAQLIERIAHRLPPELLRRARRPRPIEIRPVEPMNPLMPKKREPIRYIWLRATGDLPDDPMLHRALLAYASDFHFMPTALQPHGVSTMSTGMQTASLDHAMWFHRPFRMDQWLLHAIESPSATESRGLVRGQIFDAQGHLVASCMQEGLMRRWQTTDKKSTS